MLGETGRQGPSSHSGHSHIGNDQIDNYIRILPVQERQCLNSVFGFNDGVAFAFEDSRHVAPQELLIINYQNRCPTGVRSHPLHSGLRIPTNTTALV